MSLLHVFAMSCAEIYGNTNFKLFTESNHRSHLFQGVLGYMGVMYFLIKALMTGGLMYVSIIWEAMITVLGAIVAYFYFNERFEHWLQYFGVVLALIAMFLVHYGGKLKK